MMLIKVTVEEAKQLEDMFRVPCTSAYFTGDRHEKLEVGKLTLSIKYIKNGKQTKKRKLVNGHVVGMGAESGGHGHPGYWLRRFVPNSDYKFNCLVLGRVYK